MDARCDEEYPKEVILRLQKETQDILFRGMTHQIFVTEMQVYYPRVQRRLSQLRSTYRDNETEKIRLLTHIEDILRRVPPDLPIADTYRLCASRQISYFHNNSTKLDEMLRALATMMFPFRHRELQTSLHESVRAFQEKYMIMQTPTPTPTPTPTSEEKEKKKFRIQFTCKVEDCKGTVTSDTWLCLLNNHEHCSSCHEWLQADHRCRKEDVRTINMILRNSVPCPRCHEPISRIDGCPQMYCTLCYTPFSYTTGEIEKGHIHNPHYVELLRTLSQDELVKRGIVVPSPPTADPARVECLRDFLVIRKTAENPKISSILRLVRHFQEPRHNLTLQEYNESTFLKEREHLAKNTLTEDKFRAKICRFVERNFRLKFLREIWESAVLCIESLLFHNVQTVEQPLLQEVEASLEKILRQSHDLFVRNAEDFGLTKVVMPKDPFRSLLFYIDTGEMWYGHKLPTQTSIPCTREELVHVHEFMGLLDGSLSPYVPKHRWKYGIIQRGHYSQRREKMKQGDLWIENGNIVHYNPFIEFHIILSKIPELSERRQQGLYIFTDEQVERVRALSSPEKALEHGIRIEVPAFANRFYVVAPLKAREFLGLEPEEEFLRFNVENIQKVFPKYEYLQETDRHKKTESVPAIRELVHLKYGFMESRVAFPLLKIYCSPANRRRLEHDFPFLSPIVHKDGNRRKRKREE
jgi:hypothetical protein